MAIQGPEALLARRQFLLLFDLSFSSVSGLIRSREAATEFVETRLAPIDLAGVATDSLTAGVRLLLGFTSDKAQVRRAVETLGSARSSATPTPWGWPSTVETPWMPGPEEVEGDAGLGQMLAEEIRSHAGQLRNPRSDHVPAAGRRAARPA